MIWLNWLDLIRALVAFAALFLVAPGVARQLGDKRRDEGAQALLHVFLGSSFFFVVTSLLLAKWQLARPGMLLVVYAGWLAATIMFASRKRWIYDAGAWRRGFLAALAWLEKDGPRRLLRRGVVSGPRAPAIALFALLLLSVLLAHAWFPLHNMRLVDDASFGRALSLESMLRGERWDFDTSVAILAPISLVAGLDGRETIRFGGPLFAAVLVAAVGLCAFFFSGRLSAAYLAAGIVALYPVLTSGTFPNPGAGPEIAAVYWVLAVAALRSSWRWTLCALATALMIDRSFGEMAIVALAGTGFALLVVCLGGWTPLFLKRMAMAGGAAAFAILLTQPMLRAVPDGPWQYESVARTVERISRENRRNDWMLVAPVQELPAVYGHGWHMDVAQFAAAYTPEQVSHPDFRFPYGVAATYVVVEKCPLPDRPIAASAALDQGAYYYGTAVGRASLAFRAGRLVAAYLRAHPEASVYYEDAEILVARLPR